MTTAPIDLSVIIPTRNRAERLTAVLADLQAQRAAGAFTFEVLVVNNGSTDATSDVIRRHAEAAPGQVREVCEGQPGRPFALNAGLAQALGAIIVMTDDDLRLPPDWLAAYHCAFQDATVDGVAGRVLPRWTAPRPAWLDDEAVRLLGLGCVDHGSAARRSAEGDCRWVGGNMALRRRVFDSVGNFDTRLIRGQDEELYRRCVARGLTILYEPAAVAHHEVGAERMTPQYFRSWHDRAGYYRAYGVPWRWTHALTIVPVWRYGRMAGWAARWLACALLRKPWWSRFYVELRLREEIGLWRHRLAQWPGRGASSEARA